MSANFKPQRTAAASRGFLAIARLSCYAIVFEIYAKEIPDVPAQKQNLTQNGHSRSFMSADPENPTGTEREVDRVSR